MKDEGIQTDPRLTTAQAAILYLLRRVQVDLNLRHYMVDTVAFHRLCSAEAVRTGESLEAVEERYSEVKRADLREDRADIVKARRMRQALLDLIETGRNYNDHALVVAKIYDLISDCRF